VISSLSTEQSVLGSGGNQLNGNIFRVKYMSIGYYVWYVD